MTSKKLGRNSTKQKSFSKNEKAILENSKKTAIRRSNTKNSRTKSSKTKQATSNGNSTEKERSLRNLKNDQAVTKKNFQNSTSRLPLFAQKSPGINKQSLISILKSNAKAKSNKSKSKKMSRI